MDNPEPQATLGTQNTVRGHTKHSTMILYNLIVNLL